MSAGEQNCTGLCGCGCGGNFGHTPNVGKVNIYGFNRAAFARIVHRPNLYRVRRAAFKGREGNCKRCAFFGDTYIFNYLFFAVINCVIKVNRTKVGIQNVTVKGGTNIVKVVFYNNGRTLVNTNFHKYVKAYALTCGNGAVGPAPAYCAVTLVINRIIGAVIEHICKVRTAPMAYPKAVNIAAGPVHNKHTTVIGNKLCAKTAGQNLKSCAIVTVNLYIRGGRKRKSLCRRGGVRYGIADLYIVTAARITVFQLKLKPTYGLLRRTCGVVGHCAQCRFKVIITFCVYKCLIFVTGSIVCFYVHRILYFSVLVLRIQVGSCFFGIITCINSTVVQHTVHFAVSTVHIHKGVVAVVRKGAAYKLFAVA